MPKLVRTERQQKDLNFRAYVEKNMVLQGIDTKPELAKRMGICHSTLYRKLQQPDYFTTKELRSLFKVLHFSNEEKAEVL